MGIKVSRSAISNIMIENGFDPTGNSTNKWKKWEGMYKDHLWACDFFFVQTVKEISCMVFILIDTYSKEILCLHVHEGQMGISTFWVAGNISQTIVKLKRQPKKIVHDRDPLFKGQVIRLCSVSDIKQLRTPPKHPVMNCFCERTIQSAKYELIHHILARDGSELQKYLDEYRFWFNNHRPHQGIGGKIPSDFSNGKIHTEPISMEQFRQKKLKKTSFANGLLHAYQLIDDLKKAA